MKINMRLRVGIWSATLVLMIALSRIATATCSTGTGEVGGACYAGVNNSSGTGNYGLFGWDQSSGSGAVGTYGESYYSWGVQGVGIHNGATGVLGLADGNGNGVLGVSETTGPGVFGVTGTSTIGSAPAQAGVIGSGTGSSAFGGYFISNEFTGLQGVSTSGHGVHGISTSSHAVYGDISSQTSGSNAAVYGNSDLWGYGVYGYTNSGVAGVYGTTAYTVAVEGVATNTAGVGGYFSATDGYGVQAVSSSGSSAIRADNTSSGYGLYASTSTGTYSAYFGGGNGVNLSSSSASYYYGGLCAAGACSSDRRLKDDIKPLDGALEKLLKLKGVTFLWKNPEKHGDAKEVQRGFIAQDVEQVFPEWVGENSEGFKTVAIQPAQIASLEVEAIRTLKTENDQLKTEIAALKARNTDVLDRLDAIERGHPRAPQSPIGFNPATGVGAFGIIVGGIAFFSSRKKKEEKAS